MKNSSKKKVAIIGAGPAGLTAAYELLRRTEQYEITIYEKNQIVGGLSKTCRFGENRADIGGHRLFSKNNRVLSIWNELLPMSDEEMTIRKRKSHIFYQEKMIEYPIQISVKNARLLGIKETLSISKSYLKAMLQKRKGHTLEDFYINRFGEKMYSVFFKEYTEKLWGIPADRLSSDWGEQRVQKLSLGTILKGDEKNNGHRSLTSEFMYPAYGIGQLWEKMADKILYMGGKIQYNSEIQEIRNDSKYILTCENGQLAEADIVISSMPLKQLLVSVGRTDDTMKSIAKRLHYRDMIIVVIEVDAKDVGLYLNAVIHDHWVYIQQKDAIFGRIQLLNNWSNKLINNQNHILIEMECFCDQTNEFWDKEQDSIVEKCVADLISSHLLKENANIYTSFIHKEEMAYPVYTDGYEVLDTARNWLNQWENLYCIGRNGQHHYNNMDHSMETALKTVDVILNKSINKKEIWDVNTNRDYHEKV